MTVYCFDGTFEGLLCAVADAVAEGCAGTCDMAAAGTPAAGSLLGCRVVATRPETAARLLAGLEASGGEGVPRTLARAFLSELPGCIRAICGYCALTLERRRCVDGWLTHPAVAGVLDAVRRVNRETHRFQGLLRFVETETGLFYAAFEPDHNILVPVARHFTVRLRDRPWVIHDRRRGGAVFWDGAALHPAAVGPEAGGAWPPLSPGEATVQDLWRTYHRGIAIAGRANPALQRRLMPVRYWRYLTEMQGA